MGVVLLKCDRKGCENILCDRYSYTYGYICDECFEELVRSGLHTDIDVFMKSVKEPKIDLEGMARQRYSQHFRLIGE